MWGLSHVGAIVSKGLVDKTCCREGLERCSLCKVHVKPFVCSFMSFHFIPLPRCVHRHPSRERLQPGARQAERERRRCTGILGDFHMFHHAISFHFFVQVYPLTPRVNTSATSGPTGGEETLTSGRSSCLGAWSLWRPRNTQ